VNEFLKLTLTPQKFQGLALNTALGNFAGYLAGSLITVLSTYHSLERRALHNLFGILPRKQMVVHLMPEWLEWVVALLVGFLVMEFVRYWFNRRNYAQFLHSLTSEPAFEEEKRSAGPEGSRAP
jgi:hypothetical protein